MDYTEIINAFAPDLVLGVDWTGAFAVKSLKQSVKSLYHTPFIYLNFRVFSESTGISESEKQFYLEKECDAIEMAVQIIALSYHDKALLQSISGLHVQENNCKSFFDGG